MGTERRWDCMGAGIDEYCIIICEVLLMGRGRAQGRGRGRGFMKRLCSAVQVVFCGCVHKADDKDEICVRRSKGLL